MSSEYDTYLRQHRNNVNRGYQWLRTNLSEIFDGCGAIGGQILCHDISKNSNEEYTPYDLYFYGNNKSYAVVQNFRKAWLHHIHVNPHHWQHWILVNDDPGEGEILLEMPLPYVIEMICDWWAFSWQKGNLSEIFSWYDEHQQYIKLAPKTREIVEDILWKLRGRLGYNVLAHHGIKGQKWGVRNGPPYPLDKSQKSDTIVKDALESGKVSKTINREKQLRHTLEGHTPGRSYIYGDLDYAQELVDKYAGTGTPLVVEGQGWKYKERIRASEEIGVHVDPDTGKEVKTNDAMIVYAKTGAHIYPRKEQK